MARLLALSAVLFLAPFAAYAGWLAITKRSFGTFVDWTNRVVFTLSAIGVVSVAVGLVVLVSFSGTTSNEPYHPADIQDGQIVPGRFGDE